MDTNPPVTYSKTAANIAGGLVALVLGGLLAAIGQYQALAAVFDPYASSNAGVGFLSLGALLLVLGIFLTVYGTYGLATNVDLTARLAAQTLNEQAAAAATAPHADVDDRPSGQDRSGIS